VVEFKPLKQFLVLAEELHFGRAAARLHITQPPLSQAIQRLERELGVVLFQRTQRSVAISPAGAALIAPVQRLLQLCDSLAPTAQAAARGHSGRLRLAFVSTIAYGPLPPWLRSFRQAHPEVVLDLREATLDVQLRAFDADEIDAGFVLHAPGAAPSGFAAWRAWREPLLLALPEGHVAALRKRLNLATLAAMQAQAPLVIFPRSVAPSLHDAILAQYRSVGQMPVIAQEANQMQTIINLVSAGIGIAWVPQSLTLLQRPGVVYRRLDGPRLWCETSLIWGKRSSPVVHAFVSHVRQQAPQSSLLTEGS